MDRTYVRRLGLPRPIHVTTDQAGLPVAVANRPVSVTRDEWRVEEGWWTDVPIRRRYLELVLAGGRIAMVFEDRRRPGRWYVQQAGG